MQATPRFKDGELGEMIKMVALVRGIPPADSVCTNQLLCACNSDSRRAVVVWRVQSKVKTTRSLRTPND
jgi:hypothetical protein